MSSLPWTHEKKSKNVAYIRLPVEQRTGWEAWFLLRADAHHDNPDCDREMEMTHLKEAVERKAGILDFGDVFCAMQGRWDKRADKSKLRPEHQTSDYLDALVKTTADDYEPFAKNWILLGQGNHECVDNETEVATQKGWKKIADVTEADEVASIHPSDQSLYFYRPAAVHKYPFAGKVAQISNEHTDMLVTLNHRLAHKPLQGPGVDYTKAGDFVQGKASPVQVPSFVGAPTDDYTMGEFLIRPDEVQTVAYDGHVFCLTTQSGNFFARRNGKVFLTGNSSIRKHHETDLLERLGATLSDRTGYSVQVGGYTNWVKFLFSISTQRMSRLLWAIHGYAGGGQVTRDRIQAQRQQSYVEGADIMVSGHTHDAWVDDSNVKILLNDAGTVVRRPVTYVKTATYKDEYKTGEGGWHTEGGKPPKPLGAYWLRFYFDSRTGQIEHEVQRAK